MNMSLVRFCVVAHRVRLVAWIVLMGWLLSGCAAHILAAQIVTAPNKNGLPRALRDPVKRTTIDSTYVQSWRVPITQPPATLAVAIIDPADFKFEFHAEVNQDAQTRQITAHASVNFTVSKQDASAKSQAPPPQGTLVLLHGITMTKESMLPWAMYFAEKGYRSVLVDLRGHGRSTGQWLGYGTWEVQDLMAVVDDLERRGLLVGKLGVFGQSYGASMGIHWAARDPRVAALVALAPFDDPQTAVAQFIRGFHPQQAAKLTDAVFADALFLSAKMAGIDWGRLSVLDAMQRVKVPTLLFHGALDAWIAPAQSERLARLAPVGSRREVTPLDDHETLMLRFDLIGQPATEWFDRHLKSPAKAIH